MGHGTDVAIEAPRRLLSYVADAKGRRGLADKLFKILKKVIEWCGKGTLPMDAIRIRKTIDSETLHLPELRPLLGRTVEITVAEQPPAVRDEFWAEAARLPETQEAFEAQRATFRTWRNDPRFEPYWPLLDELSARAFDHARKWAAIQAQLPLDDYDYDAIRHQDACDMEDARRRWS
jgi:hypothetical protein